MRREVPIAIAIVVAAVAVAAFDPDTGIRTWLETRRDLETAQTRMAALEERVAVRDREAAALRDDPLALERAIREDLGLAKPGETVVRGLAASAPTGAH